MSLTANALVFRLLLAMVVLAPLPLASNRPWAWSLLALLTGGLVGAWSLLVLTGRSRAPVPTERLRSALILFVLALAWAGCQLLTVVPSDWWHPLWAEAAAALGAERVSGMISVDPALTLTAAMRLLCYGAIFWLAVQLGRERARAREGLVAVAIAGCAYAAYGLVVHFAGWETILGIKKWAYVGDLTATFVNRNAYGAYAGLGLVCSVALFVDALRPRRSEPQRRIGDFAEAVLVRAAPFLVAALVLATALLLSHSRGAFLCTGIALMVLMLIFVISGILRPRLALVVSLALLALGGGALALSGDVTAQRLSETGTDRDADGRPAVYQLTMSAILDAPWTGHGLGTFRPAFLPYRDTTLPSPQEWDYAHNVALETAMDLGLPATLALFGAAAAVAGACLAGLKRRRRDHVYPATALAALVLLAAHGLVDFSVQMPAVAATLAFLLGIGFAQSWSSRDNGETAAGSNSRTGLSHPPAP